LFQAENHPGDPDAAGKILGAERDYLPIIRGKGQVDRDRKDTLGKIAKSSETFRRHVDKAEIDVALFLEGRVAIARSLLPTTDSATTPPTEASYRNTQVFVKQDDGWKCVAWQVTRVQ
jgi:ketosteroid isomerase-like protein